MGQKASSNPPPIGQQILPGGPKMDKFKDAVKKSIPYCIDVLFGAVLIYFIYIYCLFRFKVKFYVGEEPVDPESPLGRFVQSLSMLLLGYVAQHAGNPTAELVGQTLAFISNFIKIRFNANNPMANQGAPMQPPSNQQ